MRFKLKDLYESAEIGIPYRLQGTSVFVLKTPSNRDSRGQFSRIVDIAYMVDQVPNFKSIPQVSFSHSLKRGTFRGMHVQTFPSEEIKAIRVILGSIIDYIVNLDERSENFGQTTEIEISDSDPFTVIVPAAHAHGIYTTSDNTIISYIMNVSYDTTRDVSINHKDLKLNINLPGDVSVISDKDENAPSLNQILKFNRISS